MTGATWRSFSHFHFRSSSRRNPRSRIAWAPFQFARIFSGSGSIQNEIPNGQTCTDGESNSIWYVFTANENGFLGFIITPNNLNDDYDWALFDLTNGNCSNLNANTLVSCNAAGGSGCHGRTGCSASGVSNWVPGGCGGSGPINALVPMQAGNTYVLMVSNWTGSNSGYTLDFSESTGLGVFDETPPLVEAVTNLPQSCGDQTIQVAFNEYIQCTSLANSAFQLTGPGGPYALTASATTCSSGGEQTSSISLRINPPIQELGDYTLTIAPVAPTDLLDLCDNQAEDYVFNFSVGIPLPIAIDIGQDTSLVCAGDRLLVGGWFHQPHAHRHQCRHLPGNGNRCLRRRRRRGGSFCAARAPRGIFWP
jgi:hypothetical protein